MTSIIARLIRLLIASLVGAFLAHLTPSVYNVVNDTIIAIGGKDALISALVAGLFAIAGTVWAWFKSKYHIDIALALPKGSTPSQVKEASKTFELTAPRNPIDRTS